MIGISTCKHIIDVALTPASHNDHNKGKERMAGFAQFKRLVEIHIRVTFCGFEHAELVM